MLRLYHFPVRLLRAPLFLAVFGLSGPLAFALSGCAHTSLQGIQEQQESDFRRCLPRSPLSGKGAFRPEPLEPRLSEKEQEALDGLSPSILRTIYAGRLEAPMAELLLTEDQDKAKDVRFQLQERLRTMSFDIAGTVSEIDCIGDHLKAGMRQLLELEMAHEGPLTVTSIAVGALAGVLGGAWQLADRHAGDGPIWVEIGGGLLSAALGLGALIPRALSLELSHQHNHLSPIWTGKDEGGIYPSFIWRMLKSSYPLHEPSLRRQISERWMRQLLDLSQKRQEELMALLFQEGGVYDMAALDFRVAFLAILELEVDALHRDLQELDAFLEHRDIPFSYGDPP